MDLLQWLVNEHEETKFETLLQKFDIIGRDPVVIYEIDKGLFTRPTRGWLSKQSNHEAIKSPNRGRPFQSNKMVHHIHINNLGITPVMTPAFLIVFCHIITCPIRKGRRI